MLSGVWTTSDWLDWQWRLGDGEFLAKHIIPKQNRAMLARNEERVDHRQVSSKSKQANSS